MKIPDKSIKDECNSGTKCAILKNGAGARFPFDI